MQKKSRNSRGKKRAMETHFYTMDFFCPFTRSFLYTSRKIPYNFFFMLCSYFQSNECKKISKFKREDKSNGHPLQHHGIFFFFHQNFPMNIQNDSLLFFLMPCSYFQKNECKKNLDIREGTLKQWKPTSTQRFWQSSKKSEHEGKKSDSVKKAVQGKKSDFSKKKVKNREKNKMTNFPTKNQKQVAFFTGRFFYPALLAALFIPYMVR